MASSLYPSVFNLNPSLNSAEEHQIRGIWKMGFYKNPESIVKGTFFGNVAQMSTS